MKNLPDHLAALLATAWVGGLWASGYLAVPVLFHAQSDKQLAGMLAGQIFATMGYAGIVCGTYLLLYQLARSGQTALQKPLFWIVATMLLLTLLIQFGIQPLMADLKAQALPLDVMHSTYADRFKMLHGLSSVLYLLQSLLGIGLIVKFPR